MSRTEVPRIKKHKTHIRDIIQAKKKLFVSVMLRGDTVKAAARKCGFSLAEAKEFRRSIEYAEMSGHLWDRYCKKHVDDGGKKLFVSVVSALDKLQDMVGSNNPDVSLRSIGELRQWLTSLGKSPVLEKMAEKILANYDEDAKEDPYDSPVVKRKAIELLTELRVNGKANGKANGHRTSR